MASARVSWSTLVGLVSAHVWGHHGLMGEDLDLPDEVYGFGSWLLWVLATRATQVVDRAYAVGPARPSRHYGTVDGHPVPTPSLVAWLLTAAECGVAPDALAGRDPRLDERQKVLRTIVSRAVGGEPHLFKHDWLRELAAVCGLGEVELELLARSRDEEGYSVDPQALRMAIARTFRAHPAGAGSRLVVAGAGATRSLPRDIASFTGRERELDMLMRAVACAQAGGVVGIHAIGGMAGVGKTAFTVHAAHQLAARFPGGQLFLPLHGHTPGHQPVDPQDALANLLLTTGVPARQIPSGLEARTALWRDHVAAKQLLLVLDDAIGHEQVRPLLPGSGGSLVLVTSRRHLTALDDAQTISLDNLSPDHAAELLVRLADRPGVDSGDPAVAQITSLCGYLPLAVGMLGRQLHHHPAWTPAELAADLAMARDRLELMHTENLSVAAAFDLSYQDLGTGHQQLFRQLSLHPGTDIDAYAAAALDGTDLATARRNLGALYDHYLITEPARGRYRFHDLIREHSRSLAHTDAPADQEAALDRLLDYYLHAAYAADARIAPYIFAEGDAGRAASTADMPVMSTREQAVAWMDAERLNLHAAVDCAMRTGRFHQAGAIPAAMHEYLQTLGHWDQARTLHRIADVCAQRSGDRDAHAAAIANLGDIQRLTGDLPAATASLTRALEFCRAAGNQHGEVKTLTRLAEVQWVTDDYPGATASLTRAMGLCRDLGNRYGEARALTRLGSVQDMTGSRAAAADSLAKALAIFRGLGNRHGEAKALTSWAAIQTNAEDFPAATTSLARALELYRDLGDLIGQGNILTNLGVVQWMTGDDTAAAANLTQALEMLRDLGNRFGEASALTYLGAVQAMTGDYPEAIASLTRALRLSRDLGNLYNEALALTYLGATQSMTGDYAEATTTLTQALALSRDDMGDQQAQVLNYLGELSLASGNPDEACSRYTQALSIATEKGSRIEKARALEGIGRCLLSDYGPSKAMTYLRQALAIYQEISSRYAQQLSSTLHGLK
jgi:tetratricopeptide (TPR) repeat protein